MKKYLFAFTLLYTFNFIAQPASADMPYYKDDAEFQRCVRVNVDWDTCTREQTVRALDRVKNNYRSVLRNRTLYSWHAKLEDTTQMLRDMYESWLAFRNRLCSLSHQAARNINKPHSEKEACILYYTLHHDDHIQKILRLLEHDVPLKRADFNFLKLTSHDDEYLACTGEANADENACVAAELQRSSQEIKDIYKTFMGDDAVSKWNNGPSLKEGNYRDMYDSWIAYRNRICALAVYASQKAYSKDPIKLEQCLQYFNREKLETMENILKYAHIGPQEEEEDVDTEKPKTAKKPAPKVADDGGEAEGKTIEPLQRRISSGSNNDDDSLVGIVYQKAADSAPKQATKPAESPKYVVPSWAKQK